MHTKKELEDLLAIAQITPLKKLGQNFLINKMICQRILEAAATFKAEHIVEVGPGLGALTLGLKDLAPLLTLVELDRGLAEFWKNQNLTVENIDALKMDWTTLKPFLLVSNLPYNIAGSIIIEMSLLPERVKGMVLMMQKEVAERITAPVSDSEYGILSVIAQTTWTIKKVVDAGPQDFFPVPNVGSRVLRFEPRPQNISNAKSFLELVRTSFSQRRKKLASNLEKRFDKKTIKEALTMLGLNENTRAQELSPEKFVELSRKLIQVHNF